MRKILHWLEHELRGLDDDNEDDANSLTLVVGTLVLVVPTVVVVMAAVFAVYFAV